MHTHERSPQENSGFGLREQGQAATPFDIDLNLDLDTAGEPRTLGSALRQTRLTRQLKLKDVAAQMHLPVDVLNALEEDDFDRLGAPIYVRSYLSRYAKLLGLPEDAVMARYRELKLHEPPLRVSHSPKATSSSIGDVRWLTYPLLGLAVVWLGWLGVQRLLPLMTGDGAGGADTTAELADAQPANTLLLPGQALSGAVVATDDGGDGDGAGAGDNLRLPAAGEAAARPPAARNAAPNGDDEGGSGSGNGNAAGDGGVAFGVGATPPGGAVAAAPGGAGTATGSSLAPGADEVSRYVDGLLPNPPADDADAVTTGAPAEGAALTLSFSDDCWVEVKDATGKRLLFGTYNANSQQQVVGQLPFSVTLGNSTVATLTLNGKPVDREIYWRERGVSRFVLDAQQASG